jgi:hypothetical protein
MKNTSQSLVPFGEPFPNVSAAVAALNQHQLDRLFQIARRRIERFQQSPAVQRMLGQGDPDEFVHDAIMAALLGEAKPGQGRRTHQRHLASSGVFFNFLQGIVQSLISAKLSKTVREGEHLSAEEQPLTESRTVVKDVQFNEVKTALAAKLRASAGNNPALQSILGLLELDTMGLKRQPSRSELHKMRKAGREALKELAGNEAVRDMLLT